MQIFENLKSALILYRGGRGRVPRQRQSEGRERLDDQGPDGAPRDPPEVERPPDQARHDVAALA